MLFECGSESILDADKKFEAKTKMNPIKAPYIGCQVHPIESLDDGAGFEDTVSDCW